MHACIHAYKRTQIKKKTPRKKSRKKERKALSNWSKIIIKITGISYKYTIIYAAYPEWMQEIMSQITISTVLYDITEYLSLYVMVTF